MLVRRRAVVMGLPLALTIKPRRARAGSSDPFQDLKSQIVRSRASIGDEWKVELLAHGTDKQGALYAVIATSLNSGCDWSLIVFNASRAEWKVTTVLDLSGQRRATPEANYYPGEVRVLMVKANGGAGTGCLYHRTSWYRIDGSTPTEIISYPHRFYVQSFTYLNQGNLHAAALPSEMSDGAQVRLDFKLTCNRSDCEPAEEKVDKRVQLRWNASQRRFFETGPDTVADVIEWYSGRKS